MRPWRDIPSVEAIRQVWSRVELEGKPGVLKIKVLAEVEAYHQLRKDDLKLFGKRRSLLGKISGLATDLLKAAKVGEEQAAARAPRMATQIDVKTGLPVRRDLNQKSPHTNAFMSGRPTDESFERVVLTVARRSLRKAAYLKALEANYSRHSKDPADLLAFLRAPRVEGELADLAPGVRMEAEDPYHRPFELHFDANGQVVEDGLADPYDCNSAFAAWVREGPPAPFFVWLETHPICVEDDKELVATTRGVAYVRGDKHKKIAIPKLQLLQLRGGTVYGIPMTDMKRGAAACDTSGYMAAGRKGGPGTAAYVWTEDREVFIGEHSESSFHHSSFVSGRRVRCAGMIQIKAGWVSFISNNSGHYKPGFKHLQNFARFLNQAGVADSSTRVLCLGRTDWEGRLGVFLLATNTNG